MRLPCRWIGGCTRHHDLYRPGLIITTVPLWSQLHDCVVERDANATAHADDHRLAVEGGYSILKMPNEVLGDQRQALFGANQRFNTRPFPLEAILFSLGLILGKFGDLG